MYGVCVGMRMYGCIWCVKVLTCMVFVCVCVRLCECIYVYGARVLCVKAYVCV